MGKYVDDIIWPSVFFAVILIPVLLTFTPYITSGTPYNIQSSITSQLVSAIKNPVSALSTFGLGDLAPYLYALVVALLLVHRKDPVRIKEELGLVWKPKKPYLVPIVLIPVLIITWLFLSGVFPLSVSYLVNNMSNYLILIYTLYPVAVSEELIFRGFILNRLLPKPMSNNVYNALKNSVVAIIISAIYFAMAHVPIYMAAYGISNISSLLITITLIFVYGVIAGIIYVASGSVLFDIVLHWVNDFLALISVINPGSPSTLYIVPLLLLS